MNRALDAIASPWPTFCGVAAPAYLVIGVAGVATAYTVLVARLMHEAMPLALALLVGTASLASFVLAGMLRKRLGRAPHILLEDVALALLVVAGLAFVFEIDVVRLLDRVIVAFGVFLVFGRLGCLASGCCHGRPATVGVRYPQSSIGDALAGIRLFPVQMIEAVWIALVTWWASEQHAPGTALELWLVGYGAGRFALEWLRGDIDRPYLAGLSQAQWMSLAMLFAISGIEAWRADDSMLETTVLVAAALCVIGRVTRRWWFGPPRPVLDARNVSAWMATLAALDAAAAADARRHAATTITTPAGELSIALELDRVDHGARVAAYTLAGPHDILEVAAGLLVGRRGSAHVLRAAPDANGGYVVWLHDHAPDSPDVATHPLHAVFRAHACAMQLPIVPPAAISSARRDSSYLEPMRPS